MSGEYLGRGVVACVGVGQFTGRQLQALFLCDYDEGSDSYTGASFPHSEEFTQLLHATGKGGFAPSVLANLGVVVRIPGLRRYPCADRPNYAFQFVLPGEDASPLREIAAANAQGQYTTAPQPAQAEEAPAEQQQQNDDRPMWQQMGFASKAEWRAAGSPSK